MSRHSSKSTISSIEKSVASTGTTVGEGPQVAPEQRVHMIAEAAYYLAEHRHFAGGDPMQDWLQAEAEIDHALQNGHV